MLPDRELVDRAELKMMRETLIVLVQAITDLLACLPKDSYPIQRIARIEASLAEVKDILARQRQRRAREEN
jgi:hypothetical protein